MSQLRVSFDPIVDFTPYNNGDINTFASRQRAGKIATDADPGESYGNRHTPFEQHYIGAMAEHAVAGRLGIPVDRRVKRGGDSGTDLVYRGKTLQAKGYDFRGPKLACYVKGGLLADILVAVQILGPCKVKIMGWIGRAEFERLKHDCNLGYGPQPAVWEEELHPFATIEDCSPGWTGEPPPVEPQPIDDDEDFSALFEFLPNGRPM